MNSKLFYYTSLGFLIICLFFPNTPIFAGLFIEDLVVWMFLYVAFVIAVGSISFARLIERDPVKAFPLVLRVAKAHCNIGYIWWVCKLTLTLTLMYLCGFVYMPILVFLSHLIFFIKTKQAIKKFNLIIEKHFKEEYLKNKKGSFKA